MKTNKQNLGRIIVPSGVKPVHSFDLWGVLVIQDVLGPRVISAYQTLMQGHESSEKIQENMRGYNGVLKGEKTALARKKEFVDSVEDPLWDAYMKGIIDVNFDGAIYDDAISVMKEITEAGEGLCILTTGNSPWVKKAIATIDSLVGKNLIKVYSGNKALPEAYELAAQDLLAQKSRMVSHTEDQLKGLAGILQSELKKTVKLVYVERANLATPDEIAAAGIDLYVSDLRCVDYTK
ncbi:MAG: hypothetical protein Q8O89_01470 [Nanoarchaeota archaeon]|nr:hypothetical protein [Nanoarchaeota archaeon]